MLFKKNLPNFLSTTNNILATLKINKIPLIYNQILPISNKIFLYLKTSRKSTKSTKTTLKKKIKITNNRK